MAATTAIAASAIQPIVVSLMQASNGWLQYIQVIGTLIIALTAAGIALVMQRRQVAIANGALATATNKLNLDLFERRIIVYQEARAMVLRVAKDVEVHREDFEKYDEAVQGARWLFDAKVSHELGILRERALMMSGLAPTYSKMDKPAPADFSGRVAELQAMYHDVDELLTLDALFDPFMRIDPSRIPKSLPAGFGSIQDRSQLTLASKRYLESQNPEYREEQPDSAWE